MSEISKNNIPDYISNSFGTDGVLSEIEAKSIEKILNISDAFEYPNANTEKNWLKLKSQINATTSESVKRSNVPMFIKWSVAAVLVLSVALGIWKFNSKPALLEYVYSTEDAIKKVSLPDGSIVTLNKFSKIITNDLNSDNREIKLTGEGFFEVKHNNTPFSVKTNNGTIKVTGTKFNVKNRANLPFQVALTEGQIVFTTPKVELVMKPGEVITAQGESSYIKSSISSSTLCWIDSKLVFENESLLNIIKTLENQYNTKFEYDEQLNNEKLTLTFDQLSASQAAELLSRTLNSKVTIK